MKLCLIVIVLFLAGTAIICWFSVNGPVLALASRNLEMVFVVTDAETGNPIPNAQVKMAAEEYRENGVDHQFIELVTDQEGHAKFVHENNPCEDYIRPFRKTVTFIDLTWASIDVSTKSYSPIEQMCLHTAKYDNKGSSSDGLFQGVVFNVPLHK